MQTLTPPLPTVVLQGYGVRLEPLTLEHVAPLCEFALDPSLWQWMTIRAEREADIRSYVDTALEWHAQGTALPFATVELSSGRVVGTTRFANVVREHRRAEIGWTFVAPAWQRTHVNTAAKYLMLRHAFETWRYQRVELKTSTRNAKSRAAILRLGATEEGVLRKHMVLPDGSPRDTVYFSILDDEWPSVRERLETFLARR